MCAVLIFVDKTDGGRYNELRKQISEAFFDEDQGWICSA